MDAVKNRIIDTICNGCIHQGQDIRYSYCSECKTMHFQAGDIDYIPPILYKCMMCGSYTCSQYNRLINTKIMNNIMDNMLKPYIYCRCGNKFKTIESIAKHFHKCKIIVDNDNIKLQCGNCECFCQLVKNGEKNKYTIHFPLYKYDKWYSIKIMK